MEEEYLNYIKMLGELQKELDEKLEEKDKKKVQREISAKMRGITRRTKGMRKEITESWKAVKKEWKDSKKDLEMFAEILENERKKVMEEAGLREERAASITGILKEQVAEYYRPITAQELLEYIYSERKMDDIAKYFAKEYANQLEDHAAVVQEDERKRMLASIASRIKNATEEDDAKKLMAALYAALRYYGGKPSDIQYSPHTASTGNSRCPSSCPVAPGSQPVSASPQITDQAVLDYAALLRAKEKMIRIGKNTKAIFQREDDIKKAYKDYLIQKLSAGRNDAEKAAILQDEMKKLHQAAYRDTVRDEFNKFWRKSTGWRMVISGVLVGAGIGAMFLSPFLGATIIILRGIWSGLGTWVGAEAIYDIGNYRWERSNENGAERVMRDILKNEDVRENDVKDAVYGDDSAIAESLVEGGMKVAKNVRKHRGIKRTISVILGVAVGVVTVTGIWQGIMHLFQPHEGAVGGVGFAGHVRDAAHGTVDKVVAGNSYVYVAEPGGSLWNGAKAGIEHYCVNSGITLTHNEKIYAIDWLKDRMAENPQAFDVDKWVPGHDHWIYQGEDIRIDSNWMKEAVDKAKEWYGTGGRLGYGAGIAHKTPAPLWHKITDTVTGKEVLVPLKTMKRI
jgi:hypothetical protein